MVVSKNRPDTGGCPALALLGRIRQELFPPAHRIECGDRIVGTFVQSRVDDPSFGRAFPLVLPASSLGPAHAASCALDRSV